MTYETGSDPDNVRLHRQRMRRTLHAFVVVACASFVLMAMFWPLRVRGFRSHAQLTLRIDDAVSAQQDFQNILAATVRANTSDAQLENLIARLPVPSKRTHPAIVSLDLPAIRRAISVRAVPGKAIAVVQVDFAFDGNGTAEEQQLIQIFRDSFSESLLALAAKSDIPTCVPIQPDVDTRQRHNFERVNELVAQLDEKLHYVQQSVTAAIEDHDNANPYRNASHSNAGSSIALADLQTELGSIDFKELREQIECIKSATPVANKEPALGSKLVTPIDGSPSKESFLLLGILSTAIGSVVSIHYRAFAERGFENANRVADLLRVPVIATIPGSGHADSLELPTVGLPWANRVVQVASSMLLGFVLLVGGFCIINEEVRNAFLESPFHGLSRIVWVFVGN